MQTPLRIGTILSGRYRVERVIGMGGFGITYAARHVSLGTQFAIKEFYIEGKCMRLADNVTVTYQDMEPGAFEKFRKRFHDEAITLCQLDNSHVVHVHDIFDENGTTYILMDFVVGETLQKKVEREGVLPYDLAVNYMAQLCEAVEHIHSHHILHRDIKPDNIIITPSNNVVLIDFGSARSFVHNQEQKHTAMLTVGYAPIEQYTATSKKGNYTDLYAVGATFYFILTGKKPLPAAERVIQDELQTPSDLNPQVTDAVSRTIMKALNLKPEDRYQTVEDFQRDLLGNILVPELQTDSQHAGGYLPKLHFESKLWLWISLSALLILLGAGVIFAILYVNNNRHMFKRNVTKEIKLTEGQKHDLKRELRDGITNVKEWKVMNNDVHIDGNGWLTIDSTYVTEPSTCIKVVTIYDGKVYNDSVFIHLEYIKAEKKDVVLPGDTISDEPKEPRPDFIDMARQYANLAQQSLTRAKTEAQKATKPDTKQKAETELAKVKKAADEAKKAAENEDADLARQKAREANVAANRVAEIVKADADKKAKEEAEKKAKESSYMIYATNNSYDTIGSGKELSRGVMSYTVEKTHKYKIGYRANNMWVEFPKDYKLEGAGKDGYKVVVKHNCWLCIEVKPECTGNASVKLPDNVTIHLMLKK